MTLFVLGVSQSLFVLKRIRFLLKLKVARSYLHNRSHGLPQAFITTKYLLGPNGPRVEKFPLLPRNIFWVLTAPVLRNS